MPDQEGVQKIFQKYFCVSSGNTSLMEVKINQMDKCLLAFFNILMISSIQKCSSQKKLRACRIKKGSQKNFNNFFVHVQVTHENGESAERIRIKKCPTSHPYVHVHVHVQLLLIPPPHLVTYVIFERPLEKGGEEQINVLPKLSDSQV